MSHSSCAERRGAGGAEEGLMAEGRPAFEHSTPALYDRYMGPLLFAPWAEARG